MDIDCDLFPISYDSEPEDAAAQESALALVAEESALPSVVHPASGIDDWLPAPLIVEPEFQLALRPMKARRSQGYVQRSYECMAHARAQRILNCAKRREDKLIARNKDNETLVATACMIK